MYLKKNFKHCIPLLLEWYVKYKRDLPWRKNRDAYCIWISEIMLQQTRVEAVIDYYNRFIKEIPNLEKLANISEDKLLKLWQGLGYYSRAKNLKKAAKILVDNGETTLPSTYIELIKLPGIGSYTAGAIASIAYQEQVPAVDGNVLRIMARIMGDYDDITDPKTKVKYEKFLKPYMPVQHSGDLNQAMMELGATICIPNGLARCNICPVSSYCTAYQKGLLSVLPVKKKRISRKIVSKVVFLFLYQGQFAIEKRSEHGLLASLYQFPNLDGFMNLEEICQYLKQKKVIYNTVSLIGTETHIFTHLEWHMVGYYIVLNEKIEDNYIWATLEELTHIYSLPTAFSKFLNKVKN